MAGVFEAVGVSVSVGTAVVGTGESVTIKVCVGDGVSEGVLVLKVGITVTPGVLVGTLGTYNF